MDEETIRWHKLCELATNEQDGKKLIELVEEINRIFDASEKSSKTNLDLQVPKAA